jgi:hypothetical protein
MGRDRIDHNRIEPVAGLVSNVTHLHISRFLIPGEIMRFCLLPIADLA